MKRTLAVTLLLLLVLALTAAALADSVKAVASPTYVRTGPGLKYKIVDKLSTGSYYDWAGGIEYDNRGIAWYSVYYFGGYGWVSSLHGNLISSSGYNYSSRNGANSNATSVRANRDVNVRTGPGTGYGSIGVLYSGQSADYTGHSKTDSRGVKWYQITYYGQTGWVSSKYASIR